MVMFSSSQLSEEQRGMLVKWAAEGASIADLQSRLKDEYSINLTYMDARLMVLDLGIEIIEPEKEPEKQPDSPEADSDGAMLPPDEEASPLGGGVSVTVDEIAMPGAVISGKVVFSDGEKAIWMLDQMGRPALDPDTPGYRPSDEDIGEFQLKLRDVLSRQGG